MRAVVQRVSSAKVEVDGVPVGAIDAGLVVFLGVTPGDSESLAARVAEKIARLRVFEDATGRMNLSLGDVSGAVLCVSQFTLYGDIRRGNRPSFDEAAAPELAEPLYEYFCAAVESHGVHCERGRFGAHMRVTLSNDGPVTIVVDSDALQAPRRT